MDGWRWALGYLKPYESRLAVLALLSLIEVALRVLLPWPMKAIVDHALGHQPPSPWLLRVPGVSAADRVSLLVAIAVGGALVQFLHQSVLVAHTRLFTVTGQRLTNDVRQRLFAHLQGLALVHHARMPVGEAVYRLERDAAALEQLILRGVFPMTFSAITLVVMFGVLAWLDASLALVSLAVVPFMFVWIRWAGPRLRPGAEQTKQLESRLSARLHESFSAIRLIKSFAREPYESVRFSDAADAAIEARTGLTRNETVFSLVVGALTILGTSLVVIVGGLLVQRGDLTIGTLLLALAYLGFVYGPLSGIANTAGAIHQALASVGRVRETLAIAAEPGLAGRRLPLERLRGEVAFDNVSFAYDGRVVLHDISFTAQPGEMIALVGRSGAGKTTLISLIPRFYEPTAGRVLLDGLDAARIRLSDVRGQISVLLQESIVMSGSIAENVLYGRLDASWEDVIRAASDAHAHDFITELQDGYATELGHAGGTLSGGQRQRISMARAFLKDAPILILDEPTTALDPISARLIGGVLTRLRRGRTTFVIAHNLATVREADCILVLDEGRIVARGTHEELLQSSQLYAQLAQALHVSDPDGWR